MTTSHSNRADYAAAQAGGTGLDKEMPARSGRILGISGPTVSVDLRGLKLYERVYVGQALLTGEVVRLEKDKAVVQVYEDSRGLAVGEPVKGVGMPLTVRLGPGLLGGMFDGLQRPLERLRAEMGPFITGGKEMYALDYMKRWKFSPAKKRGDEVRPGDVMGTVEEGQFTHSIMAGLDESGTIERIREGDISLDEPLGEYAGSREIPGCHEWPVRIARPLSTKPAARVARNAEVRKDGSGSGSNPKNGVPSGISSKRWLKAACSAVAFQPQS